MTRISWKECPFCGSSHVSVYKDQTGKAWTQCHDCKAQGPVIYASHPSMNADMIISACHGAWNARWGADRLMHYDKEGGTPKWRGDRKK